MRILFITANRIGDAILSTGPLDHLIERHPGARITIVCGPAAAALFEAMPGLERVITLAKRRHGTHWFDLWRMTAGRPWDLVVDLRASAIAWLLLARRRRVLRPANTARHRVVQMSDVLGLSPPRAPRLWLADRHRAAAAGLIRGEAPVLAVGPTANWGGKEWRGERFVELIARLTRPGAILAGAPVAVLGAPAERAGALPVLASIPEARRIDLVGGVDLPTAAACLERTALYIGNDSGLMHLAAASGVPTLGLFGPSREVHYAPWGHRTATVRTPESFEAIVSSPDYDYRSHATRMDSLTVAAVEAAAVALWQRCRAGE